MWSSLTRPFRLAMHTAMCCCPSQPANKLCWGMAVTYLCVSPPFSIAFVFRVIQMPPVGSDQITQKAVWLPAWADASGNVQEKGQFKLILPQAEASSFWQSELKDVFIMLSLTSLKSLFWSQSARSLLDCVSLLAFTACQCHGLITSLCLKFIAWPIENKIQLSKVLGTEKHEGK